MEGCRWATLNHMSDMYPNSESFKEIKRQVDESLGITPMSPDDLTFDGQPRCTARSKQSGERCRRARSPGTTVCATHGGKTPNTKRRARLRMLELVDPAIASIARVLATTQDDRVKLKAAEMILDRGGMPARSEISIEDSRELVADRLRSIRERSASNEPVYVDDDDMGLEQDILNLVEAEESAKAQEAATDTDHPTTTTQEPDNGN